MNALLNAGCLKPYATLTLMLSEDNIKRLISYGNSIKGFLCNLQIPFMYTLSITQTGKMAEIGCWYGRTTSIIKAANPKIKLFCIDTFAGSEEHQEELQGKTFKENFEQNVSGFTNIEIIQNFSIDAASKFDDNSLDVVWIDASHDFENVVKDINAWFPKVKKGGLLLGHDYPEPFDPDGGFQELTKAVNQEVKFNNRFEDFGWFCGIWGARKL